MPVPSAIVEEFYPEPDQNEFYNNENINPTDTLETLLNIFDVIINTANLINNQMNRGAHSLATLNQPSNNSDGGIPFQIFFLNPNIIIQSTVEPQRQNATTTESESHNATPPNGHQNQVQQNSGAINQNNTTTNNETSNNDNNNNNEIPVHSVRRRISDDPFYQLMGRALRV
ncbi:hypothetical protein TRFO_15362 [Tritrichomonas foetus]|uniref:Uncharacterized protein n=1 Tax=Tritrichomonas foetus TaxID=1144522 RepID=A0A1J4KSS7_9EUKA|nr:hypothetical protein TRFO_15362 [Tritrichomonas foetus]|eukprot:OHT14315.1 hypothetical protein TRFO_15362 [Tritrichomonas foetus]